MIRRTFLALIGMLSAPKPASPRSRMKKDGCWEAPGFTGCFICMKCGGETGCNNVTTCNCIKRLPGEEFKLKRCGESHWAIASVCINERLSIYHKPPIENCTMARNITIAVPDGDDLVLYVRDEENGGKPKVNGRVKIDQLLG
jgi:hypothetical protein